MRSEKYSKFRGILDFEFHEFKTMVGLPQGEGSLPFN